METTKKKKEWVTVRVDRETFNKLKKIAKRRGESLSKLLELLANF